MPQNVLLHFPMVDLVCLQRSVREHTRRIAKLLHEHNEYISKCKVLTSDKTSLPLYSILVPYGRTCPENIWNEWDLNVNDCTVRSGVVDEKFDSVTNRIKSSELNSFYGKIASDLKWRNSEEDFGTLTTLSCPIRFPSEEKQVCLPLASFEPFLSPSKALNHNFKNSEKKFSEFVENDVRKIESLPSSVIKSAKVERFDSKMDPSDPFDATDDDVVVIEVKKDKKVEVITIDDDEDDGPTTQTGPTARHVSVIARPVRTVFEAPENLRIPPEDLTPPSLTPEVSEPPCLSPEIMEPILTPESSQPPLIFPEIDPPLWTVSASSPVASSDDAQPPVLTPEVRDPALPSEVDTTVFLVSDESQPPLISSEVLAPMLINTETSDCPSLPPDISSTTLITLDSDSSHESITLMDPHQKSISSMPSSEQSFSGVITPQESTSQIISSEQSGLSSGYSEDAVQAMITPKKTNDITKIKGWKKKHFMMEKPEVDESHNLNQKDKVRKRAGAQNSKDKRLVHTEDDGGIKTVENAFVCDSLDKFLEGEADLNIDYEVPHLYAEVGITLTKDAVVSVPNVSDEELKSVVTKYCIPVNLKDDTDKPSEPKRKEKPKRGVKRKKSKQDFRSPKARKLEASKKKPAKGVKRKKTVQTLHYDPESKPTKVTSQRTTSKECDTMELNGNGSDGHGASRVLGLALYPGPNAPLPKPVQRHLDKIRSYQLKIDRKWANFAVSALAVPKRSKYARMILPVKFGAAKNPIQKKSAKNSKQKKPAAKVSGKKEPAKKSKQKEPTIVPIEVKDVVNELVEAVCMEALQRSSEDTSLVLSPKKLRLEEPKKIFRKKQRAAKKTVEQGTSVNESKILVSEINKPSRVRCMEHNRYNCPPCGFDHVTRGERKSQSTEDDFPSEFFVMSTPLKTNQDIANFLSQKLRRSKWKDIVVSNIDSLRTIAPNGLEFIKLSLVRDSFLSNNIYIWYLKPHSNLWNQSRAFITFSNISPITSALRFRADSEKFEEMVPKIIKDVMTVTERDSENEYAIFLGNGKFWELHGTLRYATQNPTPENFQTGNLRREEVFTPTYPPELEKISEAAANVIKQPSARWWVVDITQKFTSITSKLDSRTNILSKKSLLNQLRKRVYGFITLNKTSNRVIWVHVFPKILPYVLIGPYKLSEPHGLVLKQGLEVIPFSYRSSMGASPRFPLKNFINSVIAQVKEQRRELKGLWLCDRQQVDKTCYLELFTSYRENNFSMLEHCIDVEHGYSLKSLINSKPLTELKRMAPQAVPKVAVYLYFDIFDLGYVPGHLFQDDTVMFTNPLNHRIITISSRSFGNWFMRLLRQKIRFIPETIELKWYVTKHFEDLRDRKRFNVRYLDGSYMICQLEPSSELRLVELKPSERESGNINVAEAIAEQKRKRRKETMAEMRKLDAVLHGSSSEPLDPERVLTKAVNVIKELENSYAQRREICRVLGTTRFSLGSTFIQLLDSLEVDDAEKMTCLNRVKKLYYAKESNEFVTHFKETLLHCKFGRLYLILNGEQELLDTNSATWKRIQETMPKDTRPNEPRPKKTKTNTNRGKRRFRGLPGSVTENPVSVPSGDQAAANSQAPEATETQAQERPTTSSVRTLPSSQVYVIETPIFIIPNQPSTSTQDANAPRNSQSSTRKTAANTRTTPRDTPQSEESEDIILLVILPPPSEETSDAQQGPSTSNQGGSGPTKQVTITEVTAQEQAISIFAALLEESNAESSNTRVGTSSGSAAVPSTSAASSQQRQVNQTVTVDVEASTVTFIVLQSSEERRFYVIKPTGSTETSSEIHILNNSANQRGVRSLEVMSFNARERSFSSVELDNNNK